MTCLTCISYHRTDMRKMSDILHTLIVGVLIFFKLFLYFFFWSITSLPNIIHTSNHGEIFHIFQHFFRITWFLIQVSISITQTQPDSILIVSDPGSSVFRGVSSPLVSMLTRIYNKGIITDHVEKKSKKSWFTMFFVCRGEN